MAPQRHADKPTLYGCVVTSCSRWRNQSVTCGCESSRYLSVSRLACSIPLFLDSLNEHLVRDFGEYSAHFRTRFFFSFPFLNWDVIIELSVQVTSAIGGPGGGRGVGLHVWWVLSWFFFIFNILWKRCDWNTRSSGNRVIVVEGPYVEMKWVRINIYLYYFPPCL